MGIMLVTLILTANGGRVLGCEKNMYKNGNASSRKQESKKTNPKSSNTTHSGRLGILLAEIQKKQEATITQHTFTFSRHPPTILASTRLDYESNKKNKILKNDEDR
jgi:hypothetical protein